MEGGWVPPPLDLASFLDGSCGEFWKNGTLMAKDVRVENLTTPYMWCFFVERTEQEHVRDLSMG